MAVLTVNQIIDNIDSFINNVKKLSKSYYLFVGRPNPWNDDQNPPAANASVEQAELSIYRDLVYGKLIANTDVSYMVPRIEWTSNTVYVDYSQYDGDLIGKNFFVLTDEDEVYKCIYNNGNTASTIKPSLNAPSGTFKTADGYIWKYMYTLDPAADTKFSTTSYIPVNVDTAVEAAAVPGTIDNIRITNRGSGYEVYDTGLLRTVGDNGYTVILANSAAPINDYYKGSSIYLKAGGGAGQVREIIDYTGLNRTALVDDPFDTYVNLNLSNVQGTIAVGDTITQNAVDIAHYYDKGYFYSGNVVIQTDTGAAGTISAANSSHFVVTKNSASADFSLSYPVYNTADAGTIKSGNVRIITGNNYVLANGSTNFTTDYSVGDYIKVGNTTSYTQIRRITAVNTTVIIVDANTPFAQTYTSNVHYSIPSATTPTSITKNNRRGTVTFSNLNGVNIDIANSIPIGRLFEPGELVVQVDVDNIPQGANAIVSFANDSVLQLSSVNGTLTTNLYVLGKSSNTKAQISAVTTFPNITVQNPIGVFDVGQPIFSSSSGNAMVLTYTTIPSSLTEYIISPKVTITGDGNGALAYAYVDTSGANPGRELSDIVIINRGEGYTEATISVTSNNQYGSGAVVVADISPANGHGSNTYMELGAKYAGISVTFANGDNEGYKFPVSGEYRRFGILEDPTFNDATLNLDAFDRVKLYLGNTNGTSFINNEIVYQANTSKAGVVTYSNSSYLELKNVLGTNTGLPFYACTTNNSNTLIVGLTSNAHANVLTANSLNYSNVIYFSLLSNVESVSEVTSGATARITQIVSNTQIRVSDIKGHFNSNDVLYDAFTNAYANVVSIYISNGQIDATTDFGHKFTQTCRIPLTAVTGDYQVLETVTQQYANGTGTVLSYNEDIDIVISSSNGTFSTGDTVTDGTSGATAIVRYANSSYVKCTGSSGTFSASHVVTNQLNIGGTISAVYPVLVLYNVYNIFATGNNDIVGSSSEASGKAELTNTIMYPELVRGSGIASYIENVEPFERSETSSEKINIVIKF